MRMSLGRKGGCVLVTISSVFHNHLFVPPCLHASLSLPPSLPTNQRQRAAKYEDALSTIQPEPPSPLRTRLNSVEERVRKLEVSCAFLQERLLQLSVGGGGGRSTTRRSSYWLLVAVAVLLVVTALRRRRRLPVLWLWPGWYKSSSSG